MALTIDAAFAARNFEELYGYSPEGVWSAPGRANLIGEHTDYNAGLVLPFAINRRTFAAIGLRTDGTVRVASEGFHGVIEVDFGVQSTPALEGWSAYPLGVVQVLSELTGHAVEGFDIYLASDVPTGAGLSSSAAIECAVAVALRHCTGRPTCREHRSGCPHGIHGSVCFHVWGTRLRDLPRLPKHGCPCGASGLGRL